MSPASTLAAALSTEIVGHSSDFNGGRISAETATYLAARVLAVLAEEGWAIVKLAERCPDHNTDYYRAPEGWMVETPDYVRGCVAVEGEVMAPADARNLAAALLAAARSADGGDL